MTHESSGSGRISPSASLDGDADLTCRVETTFASDV